MSAPPYPRIECRFRRNEDHTLNLAELKRPEFGLVDRWMVTEKVDGTNIRVCLEQGNDLATALELSSSWAVNFYGRSNKAQMPDFIQEYLEATFKLEDMGELWQCRRNCELCASTGKLPIVDLGVACADPVTVAGEVPCPNMEPYPITLYGEAYGARIQKGGGNYRRDGDISFRLFDVLIGESWLGVSNVIDIADALGIKTVPFMSVSATESIVDMVREGFKSIVALAEGTPTLAEGIVARTDPYLFDGQGRRVVWKVKTKDF